MLQRAKPLFALFDGHAEVVIGVKDQRGRFHILDIVQRRVFPILIEVVKDIAAEVLLVTVGSVAGAVIAHEIGDAPKRNCGLEYIGLSHDPVGHETAVGSAGYP